MARPRKTPATLPGVTGVEAVKEDPNESIGSIQAELEAANKRIAELEQEDAPIIIMDRQAPFIVIHGKVLTVNKKRRAVPKGARYFQYGAYFGCGGIILEGQKVSLPDRPKNIRVIGRM